MKRDGQNDQKGALACHLRRRQIRRKPVQTTFQNSPCGIMAPPSTRPNESVSREMIQRGATISYRRSAGVKSVSGLRLACAAHLFSRQSEARNSTSGGSKVQLWFFLSFLCCCEPEVWWKNGYGPGIKHAGAGQGAVCVRELTFALVSSSAGSLPGSCD